MIITNIYFGIPITLKIFKNTILYSDLIKIVAYNGFQGGQKPILFIEEKNHTILIDLKKDSELLFKEFKTTTRNEIKRAVKIGVRTEITDNKNEFILFYNKFAKQLGLSIINFKDINKYNNSLLLVKASLDNEVLVMHAYLTDKSTRMATLLYSATNIETNTIERKTIGYANRLLHYKDLLLLQQLKFIKYNFGGISLDETNSKLKGIASFKKSFGGVIAPSINYYSPLYFLLLKLKKLMN